MIKIAQIIPAMRLKRSLHFFDYLIPAELESEVKIGQVVEIPFRNQLIKGVILNLTESSDQTYELKPLSKIIDPIPYLAVWQLELIRFMSEYYFVSMAMVLKMILPDIPKRKAAKSEDKVVAFLKPEIIKKDLSGLMSAAKPVLMTYSKFEEKISAYYQLINEIIKTDQQVVLIVPEFNNLHKIYQYLGDYKEVTSIFLNDLPKNKFWQEWLKIKNGQTKVIIGTRSAIFAPFKNLGAMIIDDEDNSSHKQEEPNPRYNVKNVALKIKELTGTRLIFSAQAASVSSWYNVKTETWELFPLTENLILPQISIIDRQDEFRKGNYSIFSEKLQEQINLNLQTHKKTFLFLNRKGSATLISCKDCGYVATCPTCHLPLTFYKEKGQLQCHHCAYKMDLPLTCPKCQSPELKLTGTGTEKAEADLKKDFPQAKIIRIDLDNQNQLALKTADIIIGTQYAFDFVDWNEIQAIGVINADTLFYVPDYRSMEKTYNLLAKLILVISDNSKQFICQTFSPENYVIMSLKNLDVNSFYEHEIKERREAQYPPYAKLVKLIFQTVDYNGGLEEVEETYNLLKKEAEVNKGIIINPPLMAYTQQVRGKFRWQLIIKIIDQQANLSFLNSLSDNIIIDVDPESLM